MIYPTAHFRLKEKWIEKVVDWVNCNDPIKIPNDVSMVFVSFRSRRDKYTFVGSVSSVPTSKYIASVLSTQMSALIG